MANPIYPAPISSDKPSPIAQFMNTSGPVSPMFQNSSGPMSYAPPINNTDPSGPADFNKTSLAQDVQSQSIPMPIGYMRQQSAPSQAPKNPGMSPGDTQAMGYAGAAEAGLGAGSSVQPTTDTAGSLAQVGGATLGGAATGAMIGAAAGGVGAVPGAIVGGLVGLVSSGINAWVGTSSARKQARKEEAINQAILARQKAVADQAQSNWETSRQDNLNLRQDNLKQQALNNKTLANQSQWTAMDKARTALNDMISQNANLKTMLIGQVK